METPGTWVAWETLLYRRSEGAGTRISFARVGAAVKPPCFRPFCYWQLRENISWDRDSRRNSIRRGAGSAAPQMPEQSCVPVI